jgi:hypothetical protein
LEAFVPIAEIMGTREWRRITRLAEMAENISGTLWHWSCMEPA